MRLLHDLDNLRVLVQSFKVRVCVDVVPAFRELNLLGRRYVLVADHDHAVVEQGLMNVTKRFIAHLSDIHTVNVSA